MRTVLLRCAPLLAVGAGIAVAAVCFAVSPPGPWAPGDPFPYAPLDSAGLLSIGTGNAVGTAWQVVRSSRRRCGWIAGLCAVALWVMLGSLQTYDIAYSVLGPGVEPVVYCGGGMDCIGGPQPSAPMLGSGTLMACFLIVMTPPTFVALFVAVVRGARRSAAASA